MKPLHWRPRARLDLGEGAAWYASQGGLSLELAFIAEVEAVVDLIAQHPASGSTRHAGCAPDLPSPLRFLPLNRFDRYLLYYFETQDHVEIVRLWNAAGGLEALMAGADE